MTPFQEFRYWARRAPVNQRAGAATSAIIVVALLAWLLVPGRDNSSTNVAASGVPQSSETTVTTALGDAAAAAAAATGLGSSGAGGSGRVGTGVVGQGGTSRVGSSIGGFAGCVAPPSSATGISAKEVKVAVTLTNIVGPAANSLFGIPDPAQQQADFDAVFDDVNKNGGIGCRKIVPTYYQANPASPTDLQQKCVDIQAAGVFAVLDTGVYTLAGPGCFADNKIPYFGAYFFTAKQANDGYPYVFDFNTYDRLYRDTVFALKDRGFFSSSNGFTTTSKLGYIYRSCSPEVPTAEIGWLHQIGLPDSKLSTYDVGCPTGFATPSDLQAAILQFQRDGVTHMTTAFFLGDMPNFTSIAQQQNFHPKYGLPDDALIQIAYGSQPPDANNIANAIAITASRDAEEPQHTPGTKPTPGTVRCDTILKSHGLQGVYEQPAGAGNACVQTWMLVEAANHAPALQASALAAGLQRTKSIDSSYPQGPNDFTGARVTTGGQQWRVAEFHTACKCWQLIDQTFHPSYK